MFTATSLYGVQPQAPSPSAAPAIESASVPNAFAGVRALTDLHNPLVVFGGVLLITFGLIGASGSVRLGKASFRASAGKS